MKNNKEKKTYIVDNKLVGVRIDKALFLINNSYSREYYQSLIKDGFVLINNKEVNPSKKLVLNDKIDVFYDLKKDDETNLKEYKYNLDIVYEDDDIILINKPQGLVVHPANGHNDDTLLNALIYNKKELSKVNGITRLGIVHRIDKDTSGLILIAKNDYAHNFIANQLKDHTMHREYYALVDGEIDNDNGKIIGPIGRDKKNRTKMAIDVQNGKSAITHFKVIERFKNYTLLDCSLETGRTHQIRVHLSSINHPIVGDILYGGTKNIYKNGQLLHAYKLTFIHPKTKKEMLFSIDLPQYFKDVLNKIKKV